MIARLGLGLLASVLWCGCWSSNRPNDSDSRSNWLSACDSSADCGGEATCVCGICSSACSEAADCALRGGPRASCAEPGRPRVGSCEREVRALAGRICVPACKQASDCAPGWSCVDRACSPASSSPDDAGAPLDAAVDAVDAVDVEPTVRPDGGTSAEAPDAGPRTPVDEGSGEPRLLRATAWEAPGALCATGGLRALTGSDGDRDGVLDDDEIGEDVLTCNDLRASEQACTDIGAGPPAALVACESGQFPEHCPGDALRVDDGRDGNRDGVLDAAEVEGSAFVCLSSAGCDGATWHTLVPSLACCALSGEDFGAVEWAGVELSEADLAGASLVGAVLEPACPTCPPARLSCANLYDSQLNRARLNGAQFGAAYLERAGLRSVQARGTRFENARLMAADLSEADLREASLSRGELSGAILRGADLRSADLRHADLTGADLGAAQLAGALTGFLRGCPAALPDDAWVCVAGARSLCAAALMTGEDGAPMFALVGPEADLSGANLTGRSLAGMKLRAASLRGADLSGAQLQQADLRSADLQDARLVETDLGEADLRGAVLRDADLSSAVTAGAISDATTVCADGAPGPCW